MNFILAGMVAAGIAWLINRYVFSYGGRWAIIFLVPLLEETIKTGVAVWFNAPLFFTHGVFGTIEAIVDIYGGRDHRVPAGWASFLGHLGFGLLATWGLHLTQHLLGAILVSSLGHVTWNGFVMKVLVRRRSG